MSKREPSLLIEDMIESANKILNYTQNLTYEQFVKDSRTVDAVIRNFEIIGEAASKLSNKYIIENHHVEWNKMISTRNHLIHGYFGIDAKIIWNIIQNILPKLKMQIDILNV